MMYKVNILVIFTLISCHVAAAIDITFPIRTHAVHKINGTFILGACNKGVKEFALSSVDQKGIHPLADETVTISDLDADTEQLTKEVPNPLFDQPISHIATFAHNPHIIVASPSSPSCIYLLEKKNSGTPELLVCGNIKASTEQTIAEIVFLTGSDTNYVFAAVATKDEEGSDNHEIALLQFQQKQQENKSIRFGFKQLSCTPLSFTRAKNEEIIFKNSTVVDMWWDTTLKMLYLITHNKSENKLLYGEYTIWGGYVEKDSLILNPIMPYFSKEDDSSFNQLINQATDLCKIRTLYTSTQLSYLLILEGNNTYPQQLFAVPICNMNYKPENKESHGMVAKKGSVITSLFLINHRVPTIQGRYFESPVAQLEDVDDLKSPASLVGGGNLQEGIITDIFVEGDAVYATVVDAVAGNKPGLFVSQPIFDFQGAIVNWTTWQRVAGITQPVVSASLDYKTGNITSLSYDVHSAYVERTCWARGKDDGFKPVVDVLQEHFLAHYGGIHGCFDFSYKHDALPCLSLMVCTGYKKIALVQTGYFDDSSLKITSHHAEKYVNTQGAFGTDITEKIAVISGGSLDALDMITSAECISKNEQGFLCVGGVKGLAILMHDDGTGWDKMSSGALSSLVAGMSFKKIGDYTFIRKLIYDRDYLYVLTDTVLDRIDIKTSDFMQNNLTVTTLATARNFQKDMNCSFTDCIVSEKCAFLGTNKGLWRSGNGVDIARVSDKDAIHWQYQHLLDGSDNIIQMRTVTASHQEQDCARGDGSMLYVLNGYYGHSVAYVHRFALRDTKESEVTDYTLLPIPDYKVLQRFAYYHRYAGFKNQLGVDGAYCLTGQNCNRTSDNSDNPIFGLIPMQGTGIHMPLVFSEQDKIISAIVRNSTSGSWMVTGDFGLHLNE